MKITRELLLEYLHGNFGLDPATIDDNTELFSDGLLDSFSVADLLIFIEETGSFVVEPDEIIFDNLDSIAKILNYAKGKYASATE